MSRIMQIWVDSDSFQTASDESIAIFVKKISSFRSKNHLLNKPHVGLKMAMMALFQVMII